jgi:hypothetical protein
MKSSGQNVMGLRAKIPREFNIDKKLRPQDPLILFYHGERISKSVVSWIEIVPERLWDKIHKTSEYGSTYSVPAGKEVEKLSLCSNAHSLLRKAIEEKSPDRLEELEQKNRTRIASRRVMARSA